MADEPLTGELRETLVAALQRVPEVAGRDARPDATLGRHHQPQLPRRRGRRAGVTRRRDLGRSGLGGNDTHLLGISREVEHAATVMAAGVGVGPEVVAFMRPEGYLVTRFIVGRPITDEAVHEPATIRRVADSIRRVHDGPAIPGIFVPYRIGEAYRALADARGVPIPDAVRAGGARRAPRGAAPACVAPLAMRPCHNDLLNANFIDDGARVRIVDWEYAGMGDPFFDLGNFSVNHGLMATEDELLLAAYEGAVRPERLARLRLMRVVSDFREATWGVLQQASRPSTWTSAPTPRGTSGGSWRTAPGPGSRRRSNSSTRAEPPAPPSQGRASPPEAVPCATLPANVAVLAVPARRPAAGSSRRNASVPDQRRLP